MSLYVRSYSAAMCLLLVMFAARTLDAQSTAAALAPTPLSAESIHIYRDFVQHWNNGSRAELNISNQTENFNPSEDDRKGCLKDFVQARSVSTHAFPPDTFTGLNAHLVDPRLHEKRDPGDAIRKGTPVDQAVNAGFAAAIFTLSEIVFNSDHTRAAFSYSFVCGSLCGNGGVVLYQRDRHGTWREDEHVECGRWIS
jgi:hypothetical protein